MRKIDTIIVHCTATRPNWWENRSAQDKVDEVRKWHTDPAPNGRGWSDIGYHYLIDRDGTIVEGRPVERSGAHAKGHNKTSIGVSLFGGHGGATDDAFEENFTPEQDRALRRLIAQLRMEYPAVAKVIGHNDVTNAKACPTFQVDSWLNQKPTTPKPEPKPQREKVTQSKTMQASALDIGAKAGAGIAAISALDGYAQYIVLGFVGVGVLFSLWIMRERLKKWADGIR